MPKRNSGRGARRRSSNVNSLLFGVLIVLLLVLIIRTGQVPPSVADNKSATKIVAEFDTVRVPVPARTVPAGTKLKDVQFEYLSYPKHQLPPGVIKAVAPFFDAVSLTDLPAKLPLFQKNVSLTEHKSNPVVERIPQGMRAITLKVDATSAVEGWAGSGALVDVLLVQKDQTTVVAEQVKILSAERSVSPVDGSAAPDVPSTVTILVTQEQALAINTAVLRGKIAFALRNIDDEDIWQNRVFTADNLIHKRSKGAGIQGYVAIGQGSKKKTFALADGKWIKTDKAPSNYLIDDKG